MEANSFAQSLWGYVSFGTIGQGFDVPDPSSRQNALLQTPPKTNMDPENDGYQKESPLPRLHFQVPMLLSFRGCNIDIFVAYLGYIVGSTDVFFPPVEGSLRFFRLPEAFQGADGLRMPDAGWVPWVEDAELVVGTGGGWWAQKRGQQIWTYIKSLGSTGTRAWNMKKYVGSTRMKICKSSAWQKHGSILSDFAWSQVQQTGFPSFFHRSLGQRLNMNPIWKQILWIRRMNCDPLKNVAYRLAQQTPSKNQLTEASSTHLGEASFLTKTHYRHMHFSC